ncbi:MAG: protein kinase [Deltaproteobacteria bacterium]|nr:protein kinase [Deltaproteobacteria bacterium]
MAPEILIAGPANRTRQRLAEILTGNDYLVRLCLPEDLIDQTREHLPNLLIVLDDLPQVHALIQQLRKDEVNREVPVVVALAEFSEAHAAWALEAGADEFLSPPFNPHEVLARIAVLMRLRQDRGVLLDSAEKFSQLFRETNHPLFFCQRSADICGVNPALRRFLGYPGQGVVTQLRLAELLYGQEDRERFQQVLSGTQTADHVKVRLANREGQPVTVLLKDLSLPEDPEVRRFQVQAVGTPSPLRKAIQGLVDHLIPSARDHLALLKLTPLLGGRYEKIKKLGQGSFGEVWLVLDTEAVGPQRHYVAKIPFLKAANAKFRKEAAICAKLTPHPGVVQQVDLLEDEGRLVLIQEYLKGKTLADMLGEELPRPIVERIVLQLIDVVSHAHYHRIMHRDIKPTNIIIQPDGTLKLLDFGSAKIVHETEISATMVGSRPFMAPEQIMGKSERRSDIWAIGVLMYLLYTGELPFYSEVEKLLIDQILEQEPTPPRELDPEIPEPLEAIILKCLKKNVAERYPHALALKEDLLRQFPHYGTQTGRWPWIQ